jgi:hypothetical protein
MSLDPNRPIDDAMWERIARLGDSNARHIVTTRGIPAMERSGDGRMILAYLVGALTAIAENFHPLTLGDPESIQRMEAMALGYVRAAIRGTQPGPDGLRYPIDETGAPLPEYAPAIGPTAGNA